MTDLKTRILDHVLDAYSRKASGRGVVISAALIDGQASEADFALAVSELAAEKKLKMSQQPMTDDGLLSYRVSLVMSAKERQQLYRERQKALGRRQVVIYMTEDERKAILTHLESIRRGQGQLPL